MQFMEQVQAAIARHPRRDELAAHAMSGGRVHPGLMHMYNALQWDILLRHVGNSATDPPSGLAPKGGAVTMKAGDSTAMLAASGGKVIVMGGEGRNQSNIDGVHDFYQ